MYHTAAVFYISQNLFWRIIKSNVFFPLDIIPILLALLLSVRMLVVSGQTGSDTSIIMPDHERCWIPCLVCYSVSQIKRCIHPGSFIHTIAEESRLDCSKRTFTLRLMLWKTQLLSSIMSHTHTHTPGETILLHCELKNRSRVEGQANLVHFLKFKTLQSFKRCREV